MIKNIKKLKISTILTSFIALGGLPVPTIAQENIILDMNHIVTNTKSLQHRDSSSLNDLQISQAYNRYSGSWSGNFQLDYGNRNSCSSRGQLQFTVDGQGALRGILLASGEKMQFNGVVKPNGSFVAVGNEGTEARGNFYGNEFVGVYGNQTWGCSGRIGGRKF